MSFGKFGIRDAEFEETEKDYFDTLGTNIDTYMKSLNERCALSAEPGAREVRDDVVSKYLGDNATVLTGRLKERDKKQGWFTNFVSRK